MDGNIEELSDRVLVADVSSAIAFGLQRAIERRGGAEFFADKILRYGGRLHFEIEIAPQIGKGFIQDIQPTNQG